MSDEQGAFVPVGRTQQRMFGPIGVVLCGFTTVGQQALFGLWAANGLADVPVSIAVSDDASLTCLEVLGQRRLPGTDSTLPRAVLVSGLEERQLHDLMQLYRQSGAPRPLWAALTEHSQHWPLGQLLGELQEERRALEAVARNGEGSASGPGGGKK